MMDPYYLRSEVSNSNLSTLKKELSGNQNDFDPKEAYKFGTLIDAIITEPDKIDWLRYKCNGEQYEKSDFEKAKQMEKSFLKDKFASSILPLSDTQKIMINQSQKFNADGLEFSLDTRCKWDLWMPSLNWGGDIKSTTAKTQKQFEEAARYFDYDRQRAWYMDIAGSDQDVLIAISKENFKIFKIHINRDDEFYKAGKAKYMDLAYRYWLYFGNI